MSSSTKPGATALNPTSTWQLAVALVLAGGATLFALPDEVPQMREAYDTRAEKIHEEFGQKRDTLAGRYLTGLDGIEKQALHQGDLESVLAIRAERDRCKEGKGWPEHVEEGLPRSLRDLQSMGNDYLEQCNAEEKQKLEELGAAFLGGLLATVQKMSSEGRMAEASEVRDYLRAFADQQGLDLETERENAGGVAGTEGGDEAGKAFANVMASANLPVNDYSDKKLIELLRNQEMNSSRAMYIRSKADDFLEHYGDSEPAKKHRRLLEALADFRPAPSKMSRPPNLDISVKKSKSTGLSGTDYDNKRQRFQLTVKIRNSEALRDFEGLKGEVYAFGKGVTSGEYVLLDSAKSEEFDLERRGGEHEFSGRHITLSYDDNAWAQYGIKYKGYHVVIRDRADAIIATKSTSSSFEKNYEKFKDASGRVAFDSQFNNLGSYSGVMY